ncbi:MAG: mechanosensitive ion channel family protein [Methanohalobium sp.]|uniref:mechanosensitive ion channel family protein n=1 Tax=Methanohalobium sp. TaxID=2837493 RepID=UPI00397D0A7D
MVLENYFPDWLLKNLQSIIFIFAVIIASYIIAKVVDRALKTYFHIVSKKIDVDETIYNLVRRICVALIYFAGLVIIILSVPTLRDISLALFAGAGFAGIVVGMAAQSTLSNVIAGISLAAYRPFRVGDRVTINNEYGEVSDITLGHTVVATWDNRRLIIPNHIISDQSIINWTIEDTRVIWPIDMGISYDSDIDYAKSLMIEEAKKHPNVMKYDDLNRYHPKTSKGEGIEVYVTECGDFAVNLRLFVWIISRNIAYTTGCEIREAIKKRFDAEGIEIPFPYRTIVYKKDIMQENE